MIFSNQLIFLQYLQYNLCYRIKYREQAYLATPIPRELKLNEDRTELITKIIKDLSGLIDVVSQKKEDIEPFCTICQNQIEDTSFLPCSHQFCCSCLILYVRGKILDHEKLGYRNLQTLNIPCPNCKVIFPYQGELESWFKQAQIEIGYDDYDYE